jgi:hypothetical protein
MDLRRYAGRFHQQVATHSKVEQQPIVSEPKIQEFASPTNVFNYLADETGGEFSGSGFSEGTLPA